MDAAHPNLLLLQRLDIHRLDACRDLFSDDFVFHYFNPKLPDLEGDYEGLVGLQSFFNRLAQETAGSFTVTPVSATPVGDELVVVQTRNALSLNKQAIEIDVVIVWRIVEGRFLEAWDIPSAYTLAAGSSLSHP